MPYTIANTLIRIGSLVLLGSLAAQARQAAGLRERIRLLEGILPICSFCKAIRERNGNWTAMESYISAHSEARFNHGVCPTCARQHYAEAL